MRRQQTTLEERFAAKYAPNEDGCWIWAASCNDKGYGEFSFNGKLMNAHRASFLLHRGEIPSGMCVLHRCDVRPCVNPEHLFLGTQADNVRDCIAKGRSRCARGEQHHDARLSSAQIANIRMLAELGAVHRNIAEWFTAARGYVSSLVRGEHRRHG